MNRLIFTLLLISCFLNVKAQTTKEKTGLFKNLTVKTGLTMSYFYNVQGDYLYILQPDAHVKENTINHQGAALSLVVLFKLNKSDNLNFVLNIPFFDVKSDAVDVKEGLFNSQTPFGVGLAYFPFKTAKFLGFSGFLNIGRQNRLNPDALANRYFPIADYPTFNLQVYGQVPDAVMTPFLTKETTYSGTLGFVIRL